ncbi:ssDNA-binding protein, mitochondrial, partial [Cryomyces antarcticus]
MFSLRRFATTSPLTITSRAFSFTPRAALARMQIIGRLAAEPELMPTSTGKEMVRYTLGVSTGARDASGIRLTSWFRVASFSEGPGRDLLLSLPKG